MPNNLSLSVFATVQLDMFNWSHLFKGCKW